MFVQLNEYFRHNKDFCSSFFILTTNFVESGYFSENTKPLSLVKLNHSHRKYSRKKVLQEDIPEVSNPERALNKVCAGPLLLITITYVTGNIYVVPII